MANTTSKTDIINLALANLGQDTITSSDQETATARTANLMYDFVRRNLLRAHDWAFALRTADLAQSETASPFDNKPYVYAQPADCVFIKKIIYDGVPQKVTLLHQLFTNSNNEKLIACPFEATSVLYVRDEENPTLFDPAFVACFALLLAAELAVPLTGDTNLAQLMLGKYQSKLDEARISNKVEQLEKGTQDSVFLEAR
jgi:hypothetical protein